MIYRVKHVTTYTYAEPVLLAHHQAHLTPRSVPGQTCQRAALHIEPTPTSLDDRGTDYFGNPVTFFAMQDPHRKLVVKATSTVAVEHQTVPAAEETPPWDVVADQLACQTGEPLLEVADFFYDSPLIGIFPEVRRYAESSFPPGRPILACLIDLNQRVHNDFAYDPTATTVSTPLSQVLAEGRGVCQDFAHLAIACVRSVGLPARYVSGYLLTHPPPGEEKLRGSDASHAWLSAYLPGAGWLDLDPTNDCLPGTEHVTLGWGRDYDDVSPLRGVVLGGGDHSLKVAVDVEPLPA